MEGDAMHLIRWTPNRSNDLSAFRNDIDRLFEDFLTTPARNASGAIAPAVDVEETPEAYVFRADLPGVDPKAIKVNLTGDVLTLRGERSRRDETRDGRVHRVERAHGAFERRFQLGTAVRGDQVRARYRDGVLEVTVPKADEARSREVEVQVG
jgi:HSP20 family protein